MKSQLAKWIGSSLMAGALVLGASNAQSQTTNVLVDPASPWIGYMNWSADPNDPAGDGGYGGGSWGTAALAATFTGTTLTLSPNTNVYEGDLGNTYWVNPDGTGANIMDANFYVENDNLGGYTITFSGYCHSNSISSLYTSTAFIKDFNSSYSVVASASTPFTNGQPFTITLATTAGDHIQYGFETIGPEATFTNYASLGVVQVSSNSVAAPPLLTPTNAAPTPTAPAGSVLAMYNSSGVYTDSPVQDFLATWSSATLAYYTIPGTSRMVLQYGSLSFAGVEFGNPDQFNVSSYNTMHVDVWTPNANEFGIQLVSLDPGVGTGTQAAEVDFFPSGNKITTNKWISLDIPLSNFTATNSTLDLTDLQQLLWIDNMAVGVVDGIFYIDNVYFYNAVTAPTPKLTATVTGTSVKLSFPTVTGYSYNVQYKNSLTNASWTTLSTVTGDGQVHTVPDTASQSHRYYRIHP